MDRGAWWATVHGVANSHSLVEVAVPGAEITAAPCLQALAVALLPVYLRVVMGPALDTIWAGRECHVLSG